MRILVFLMAMLSPLLASAGTELLMVEQPGCVYCARWDKEIAPAYPHTVEGRTAPLRRIELDAPLPEDIVLDGRPVVTPTFILLVDGKEKGRLLGYAGDQYFWYLLDNMMGDAGVKLEPAS